MLPKYSTIPRQKHRHKKMEQLVTTTLFLGFTPYGNNCYITGGDVKDTWENGRQWCRDNGAELVSITNGFEQVTTAVKLR